jgi:hypothetical protein
VPETLYNLIRAGLTQRVHKKGDSVMKKTVIAILSALLLPATSFAAENMRDGYWELTTTMEMPGMPMKMAPSKIKHCYTKEDVKDQRKAISTDKNCTVTDFKQSGNKVIWKMKCTGQNAGVFSGETIFRGDSYDSIMNMKTQGHTMNVKVKAKRLGSCP